MAGARVLTLADYLRVSNKALIFTGAGISTGSGIPDFRGPEGVWKRRQPVYFQDFMASEAARIEHWDYKLEGRDAFRDARPNAVHQALVRLEESGKLLAIITQNIDGLHRAAGTSADRLVELHGTNAEVECQSCHHRDDPERHFESFRLTRRPPLCPCGGFLKPAASFPLLAAQRGAPYIIVNRGATEHDGAAGVSLRLEGEVGEILPPAVDAALARPTAVAERFSV